MRVLAIVRLLLFHAFWQVGKAPADLHRSDLSVTDYHPHLSLCLHAWLMGPVGHDVGYVDVCLPFLQVVKCPPTGMG